MDKAAKAVRRSGVKLLSLGGGHADLKMVISEQKDMRNTAKAFMAAQNSASQYLLKWAANEENRAIQDVSNHIVELNMLWTEAQREFLEQLKEFRQMFELILEGEKYIDQAKHNLSLCEQRETKVKKELKKAAKKASAEEYHYLDTKLKQAERAKDLAQLEVEDRIRENEAVKVFRFKEGLLRLSEAYQDLGKKCAIIHNSQSDIAHHIPDVQDVDLEEIKYTGSGASKQYVLQAKDKVRQLKRQSSHKCASLPQTTVLEEPPPPYTPGDYYDLSEELSQCIIQDLVDDPIEESPRHHHYVPAPHITSCPPTLRQPALAVSPRQRSQDIEDDANDRDWGSDCEDDITGAMGGANL